MSSRSPENLLLYLPKEEEDAIRGVFDQLAARGLPLQHQRPHITITFAQSMPPHTVDLAARLLPPLMPAHFTRAGTVIFGTKSKQTIAWLLDTTPALADAAGAITATNPENPAHRQRWIPHLTMGLRVPRTQVPAFIQALDEIALATAQDHAAGKAPHNLKDFTATQAGYWRPATGQWQEFTAQA